MHLLEQSYLSDASAEAVKLQCLPGNCSVLPCETMLSAPLAHFKSKRSNSLETVMRIHKKDDFTF